MTYDPRVLPAGLPVPEDDGGADHLTGLAAAVASACVDAGRASISRHEAQPLLVLYVYPRTGRPGVEPHPRAGTRRPAREAARRNPAATGTTATSFVSSARASSGSRRSRSTTSARPRSASASPMRSSPIRSFGSRGSLGLPTFDFAGLRLYKRLSLVAESGRIARSSTRSSRPTRTQPTSSPGSPTAAGRRDKPNRFPPPTHS